jgi:hypothetical protein
MTICRKSRCSMAQLQKVSDDLPERGCRLSNRCETRAHPHIDPVRCPHLNGILVDFYMRVSYRFDVR